MDYFEGLFCFITFCCSGLAKTDLLGLDDGLELGYSKNIEIADTKCQLELGFSVLALGRNMLTLRYLKDSIS